MTIEVPVDHAPRERPNDADYEILQTCSEIGAVGRPVLLVTDDTGLSIRAAHAGINHMAMPEKYLRKRE